RTPQGKIDRRSLPPPAATPAVERAPIRPRTSLERQIAAVWTDVLRVEEVGIDSNFFELGGNSFQLIQVYGKLCQSVSGELLLVELFEFPTIRLLARRLSQTGETPASSQPSRAQIRQAQWEAVSRQQRIRTEIRENRSS